MVINRLAIFGATGDEAGESWRVVTPVLEAWAKGVVPLQD